MKSRIIIIVALIALLLFCVAAALWWNTRQHPAAVQSAKTTAIAEKPAKADKAAKAGKTAKAADASFNGAYVLTISWHPAFCETKPNLAECRAETEADYSAGHFSLHGLWPQKNEYCGVAADVVAIDKANRWSDLPKVDISAAVRRNLEKVMPGTEDSLERHEWILHGTCAGVKAGSYFKRAIALVDELNASDVQVLLAGNIDRAVTRDQIRAAFDKAFGKGAGSKVRIDCEADGERSLIAELRINLKGAAMSATSLRDLIKTAGKAGNGCQGGIVDRVGGQ